MIVGSTIMHPGDTSSYYSPSFPRGGQAATFTVDVTHLSGGSVTFIVAVEHKNADDTTWSNAATFSIAQPIHELCWGARADDPGF